MGKFVPRKKYFVPTSFCRSATLTILDWPNALLKRCTAFCCLRVDFARARVFLACIQKTLSNTKEQKIVFCLEQRRPTNETSNVTVAGQTAMGHFSLEKSQQESQSLAISMALKLMHRKDLAVGGGGLETLGAKKLLGFFPCVRKLQSKSQTNRVTCALMCPLISSRCHGGQASFPLLFSKQQCLSWERKVMERSFHLSTAKNV